MESLYKKKLFPYLFIILVTLLSTLVVWLPFLLRLSNIGTLQLSNTNFQTIEANWDGPLYIIPAKTLYSPAHAIFRDPPLNLKSNYYAAHLPLYPITIKLFALLFSYPKAMLLSTLTASCFLFCLFFYFCKRHKITSYPLLLTMIFMMWPRLLIVRSVGSPEPLFLTLILSSVFLFIEKKYLIASILGALAVWTKIPGVLLFPGFCLYFFYDYFKTKKIPISAISILIIPLSLIGLFYLYKIQLHDFFAYYHTNAVVPMPQLFAVFNANAKWVGTSWLEDIVFIFILIISATLVSVTDALKENSTKVIKTIACFMVAFLIPLTFVEHRDISRYSLPLMPFVFMAFARIFTDKRFIVACCFMLPAIYLYAINFILGNIAPITDWLPFL